MRQLLIYTVLVLVMLPGVYCYILYLLQGCEECELTHRDIQEMIAIANELAEHSRLGKEERS